MNKDKKKVIALLVLLAAFLITAAFIFLRPERRLNRGSRKKPVASAVVADGLTLPEELAELADWLARPGSQFTAGNCPNEGVLGLDGALPAETEQQEATVPTRAPFVEPPSLEGVFWRNRTPMAVFGGETYGPGQKIRNTDFTVVHIGRSTVKLRSEAGQEMELNLLN